MTVAELIAELSQIDDLNKVLLLDGAENIINLPAISIIR